MFHTRRTLLLGFSVLGLWSCAPGTVKEALHDNRPTVSISDQRITRLDFNRINMLFNIQIDNPNPVGITLGGLDYDLKLAGQSIVSGRQDKRMALKAAGRSGFELPLSMGFSEVYQVLGKLKDKDELPYELTTGLSIDVPLLGKMRYPVSASGVVPLPRPPKVSVSSLTLERLSFSGATLALKLGVDNPNGFAVALDKLQYDFQVNGKRWLSGNRNGLGNIAANRANEVTLPITLNFTELGSGLYGLLNSGQALDYKLSGKLDATAAHPLLGSFALPLNSSGRVALAR